MDALERSFLAEAQRQVESGRSVEALVRVHYEGDGVRIEEDAAVLLLGADARVDDRDRYGNTALHWAAFKGHTDMSQLLSRGASLDARRINGDEPEARARRNGRTATADVLAAVRAAGGWRPYCTAQFLELRRELRAPGAVAEFSERLYERVFVELPNDVFPPAAAAARAATVASSPRRADGDDEHASALCPTTAPRLP
ncbi:SET domain-containing protein [Aureococcus anophagefferens]|nr:SET domain-containing protein [Aureococcus anophagefferens]